MLMSVAKKSKKEKEEKEREEKDEQKNVVEYGYIMGLMIKSKVSRKELMMIVDVVTQVHWDEIRKAIELSGRGYMISGPLISPNIVKVPSTKILIRDVVGEILEMIIDKRKESKMGLIRIERVTNDSGETKKIRIECVINRVDSEMII